MKAIRRSIKGERSESKPNHISITPKSAIAIQPPKKVIKALYDYSPDQNNPNELGFHKGDFFHVISRENDEDWYEACNPLIPSARGLVPVSYFEVIGKTERQSTGSNTSGVTHVPIASPTVGVNGTFKSPGMPSQPIPQQQSRTQQGSHIRHSSSGRGAMVYGIVMYDFNAERPDELDAKAGEAIIVIAQSNPEWFVAKPIGRLGGPGLIPVSFIEIRDMTTGRAVEDPHAAVQAAGVPRVEEWKKLAADYKNSSISLGKFDIGGAAGPSQDSLSRGMERMSLNNRANGNHQQSQLLAPIKASIPRYCFENDKYWYIIECQMEDGSHWELSRYYQDFYDFQISLLQEFPNEASAEGGNRILPYMPGPVTYVTDAISNGRRESLDTYIKQLLSLPPYISKCHLVRSLFAARDGDFELDPKAIEEDYRLSRASHNSSTNPNSLSQQSSQNQLNGGGYGQNAARYPNNNMYQSNQGPPPGSTGALKIKVWFEDDCIAIRVPSETNFAQLRDKLHERLKVKDQLMIQYKDEPSQGYAEILTDHDLDVALQRNPKLQLYVGYA